MNDTGLPTGKSIRRAEYITNHYSNSHKDTLVLARHLDAHDADVIAEELLREAQWIPVEEKFPEVDIFVLAVYGDGSMDVSIRSAVHEISGVRHVWCGWDERGTPTHWRPLPPPPEVRS